MNYAIYSFLDLPAYRTFIYLEIGRHDRNILQYRDFVGPFPNSHLDNRYFCLISFSPFDKIGKDSLTLFLLQFDFLPSAKSPSGSIGRFRRQLDQALGPRKILGKPEKYLTVRNYYEFRKGNVGHSNPEVHDFIGCRVISFCQI